MRRLMTFLVATLFASALLTTTSLVATTPVSAATIAAATTCSNGVDTTPGLGLICEVNIINTITAIGGSATVTVRECHGAAGAPAAACMTTTDILTEPVTSVTQCNGSISSGGTLRCAIDITNNFVGIDPAPFAATVNQCVGSGDGITTGCNPFPATTTGAMITQCNGSANGLTLVELRCRASGTESAAFRVTINQCNGSANDGGSLVICAVDVSNQIVAAPTAAPTATPTTAPAPTATAAPGGATPGSATLPPTDATAQLSSQPSPMGAIAFAGALFLVALSLMALVSERGRSPKG